MKKKLVLVLGLVMALMAFALPVVAAENEWVLTDITMPSPSSHFGSCIAEGKLYFIGGGNYLTGSGLSRTVHAYDFETNMWEQKADLPVTATNITAVYFDGKIYAFGVAQSGGVGTIYAAYSYDIATNTWTTKANMPTEMANLSAVVADGKIYVCGGHVGVSVTPLSVSVSSALYVYDPQSNTWTQKASMLTAATGSPKLVYHKGEIYFFGGLDNNLTGISSCQKYNIAENRWYKIADMPKPRGYTGIVTVDSDVYVIGGYTNNTVCNEVHKYSLDTDTWEQVESLLIGDHAFGAEYINGQIYIFGGMGDNGQSLNTVYTYTPSTTPTPPVVTSGNALLRIYISNGLELEYDTTASEVNSFVTWFNNRANGTGPAVYAMKKTGNFGPFNNRTDYLVFDKIVNWEVNEYSLQ